MHDCAGLRAAGGSERAIARSSGRVHAEVVRDEEEVGLARFVCHSKAVVGGSSRRQQAVSNDGVEGVLVGVVQASGGVEQRARAVVLEELSVERESRMSEAQRPPVGDVVWPVVDEDPFYPFGAGKGRRVDGPVGRWWRRLMGPENLPLLTLGRVVTLPVVQ